ncbi:putative host specificity protein, partial [Escherichia coli PA34]
GLFSDNSGPASCGV